MTYNNQELYHFGVKGMRWGVRKHRDLSARKTLVPTRDRSRRQKDIYKQERRRQKST